MATLRLATTARNAAADAVVDLLDVGTTNPSARLLIYSGSQPATPQTAATGTLLATVALSNPAAGAASAGAATITDPASVTGAAAGTAGWARFTDRNNTAVMDCDVTATGGGGAIELSTTTISVGVAVDIAAITYTTPQG